MDDLRLICWIRGQKPTAIFQVKISKTEIIYDLQKAIKNEKPNTFRDVDADTLPLYKPKDPVSRPYEDHLRTLNLWEHGTFLEGAQELSEVFPEPPPEEDIHVIVDAPLSVDCWLRRANPDSGFQVSMTATVPLLQKAIKNGNPAVFPNVDAGALRLYKISGDESELQGYLNETGSGERLQKDIIANFLDVPVLEPLRVVIDIKEIPSPPIVQQPIPGGDRLQDYQDIFLKMQSWEQFERSDIQRNKIENAEDMVIPDFVETFQQELDRKPRLPIDLPASPLFDPPRLYFECSEDSIAGGGPQEEVRSADMVEVMHTAYHVASPEWEECWKTVGSVRPPLKQPLMDSIFFDMLLRVKNKAAVASKNKDSPITVVVKRDGGDELRKYCPRCDFSISLSTLPRLLVEVNSTPQHSWPTDLIRMLTTGAFIVRFANKYVSTFKEKNFVLCAVFVHPNGDVTRYTLFQKENDEMVYYNEVLLSLNDRLGRAEFVRFLYNLLAIKLDREQDNAAKHAIRELHNRIKDRDLTSLNIKNTTDHSNRKRHHTNNNGGDGAGGGSRDDRAQFRAHGYEVKPDVIVDDSGGELRPLSQTPDHILTVYRPSNSDEEFIAKKVREESNELKIFRLLDTIPFKSDHVISLIDSFNGWAIQPKMITVGDYIDFRAISDTFESKVSQVCLGLVKGVAYLHEHRIAHRDIKPDNLVVDKNFNLKIIDFDIAMQVKDEDEEVDDQCGTRDWMAPEVEKKLWHSPIKADRWACGRVLQSLLDRFSKEDRSLRVFARDLTAHDPNQRPSMVEWGRYSALPFSDAGNIGNSDARKVSRPRQDRVDGDGESTRPPNVKKQRLELGQFNMGGFRGRHGLGFEVEVQ